ncbi:tRNA (adenosine(37)-N6)-dimethylallyltransferase MiaA [Patescibacteria group bacterium]|nr:tRNA (adenosine(37)-N6)-dimethylallyltransferase MiaA [Patescibacteria group bacterium]
MNNNKLIIILGPTASGKTGLAIKLAQKYNGEIISADSRQIYKEMTIGTAKPTKDETEAIKHHLVDCIKPNHNFTLDEFIKKANRRIKSIQRKGKVPFLVGGTGLYISAIVNNYDLPKGKIDLGLRKRLESKSKKELLEYLNELDPITTNTIDKENPRRLIRALEYVIINKKSFANNQKTNNSPYNILQIGIALDQPELNKRIELRTNQMIELGLVKETQKLIDKYDNTLPSLNTIGYQEIIQHLNKEVNLNQAIDLIKIHTRQYAKRQMTWFKRDKRINWIKFQWQADSLVNKFLK